MNHTKRRIELDEDTKLSPEDRPDEWVDILSGTIPWSFDEFAEAAAYVHEVRPMSDEALRALVHKRITSKLSKEQKAYLNDTSPINAAVLLWFFQRYGDRSFIALSHYTRFRAMLDFVYDNAEDLEAAGLMEATVPNADKAPVAAVTDALSVLPYDKRNSLDQVLDSFRPLYDKERIIRTASRWHEIEMKKLAGKEDGQTSPSMTYAAPTLLGVQTRPARIRLK